MDQAGMVAAHGKHPGDDVLLADVVLGNVFDGAGACSCASSRSLSAGSWTSSRKSASNSLAGEHMSMARVLDDSWAAKKADDIGASNNRIERICHGTFASGAFAGKVGCPSKAGEVGTKQPKLAAGDAGSRRGG